MMWKREIYIIFYGIWDPACPSSPLHLRTFVWHVIEKNSAYEYAKYVHSYICWAARKARKEELEGRRKKINDSLPSNAITWSTCQDAPISGLHRTYGRLTVAYPYAAVECVVFCKRLGQAQRKRRSQWWQVLDDNHTCVVEMGSTQALVLWFLLSLTSLFLPSNLCFELTVGSKNKGKEIFWDISRTIRWQLM